MPEVLRTRTFLFSDVREYTAFVQQHGDVAARVLIGEYRRIVRAEITKHEGAGIKTEGDSLYLDWLARWAQDRVLDGTGTA